MYPVDCFGQFSYYIIKRPLEKKPPILACALTIFLGIATLGSLHAICGIYLCCCATKENPKNLNPVDVGIQKIVQKRPSSPLKIETPPVKVESQDNVAALKGSLLEKKREVEKQRETMTIHQKALDEQKSLRGSAETELESIQSQRRALQERISPKVELSRQKNEEKVSRQLVVKTLDDKILLFNREISIREEAIEDLRNKNLVLVKAGGELAVIHKQKKSGLKWHEEQVRKSTDDVANAKVKVEDIEKKIKRKSGFLLGSVSTISDWINKTDSSEPLVKALEDANKAVESLSETLAGFQLELKDLNDKLAELEKARKEKAEVIDNVMRQIQILYEQQCELSEAKIKVVNERKEAESALKLAENAIYDVEKELQPLHEEDQVLEAKERGCILTISQYDEKLLDIERQLKIAYKDLNEILRQEELIKNDLKALAVPEEGRQIVEIIV